MGQVLLESVCRMFDRKEQELEENEALEGQKQTEVWAKGLGSYLLNRRTRARPILYPLFQ